MSETVGSGPISFKLTAEDYAGFNRYHGRRPLLFLFVFYCALFVIIAKFSGTYEDASSLAFVIPAAVVISGLMVVFQLWRINTRTHKLFSGNKAHQLDQRITLTETGIRHHTGEADLQVEWGQVLKAAETKQLFIVYLAQNKAILLPKRDIADPAEVRETFRRELPPVKLRLRG